MIDRHSSPMGLLVVMALATPLGLHCSSSSEGSGGSNGVDGGQGDVGSSGDDQAAPPGDDGGMSGPDAATCQGGISYQTYSPNLAVMGQGGQIQFVLQSAKPAPPKVGINTFTLQLLDASGRPITGATFAWGPKSLWMPLMVHGSSAVPTVTDNGDGTYTVKTIDLSMPGIWQFTFTAQTGSLKDTAMYTFCVGS
jgi:hypothetical protein